jgi:hypothetical protein
MSGIEPFDGTYSSFPSVFPTLQSESVVLKYTPPQLNTYDHLNLDAFIIKGGRCMRRYNENSIITPEAKAIIASISL